jgi:hypothetical protein
MRQGRTRRLQGFAEIQYIMLIRPTEWDATGYVERVIS